MASVRWSWVAFTAIASVGAACTEHAATPNPDAESPRNEAPSPDAGAPTHDVDAAAPTHDVDAAAPTHDADAAAPTHDVDAAGAGPGPTASILVMQSKTFWAEDSTSRVTSQISAYFLPEPPAPLPAEPCEVISVGQCALETCPAPAAPSDTRPPPVGIRAGEVTIRGLDWQGELVFVESSLRTEYATLGGAPLWSDARLLTLGVTGSEEVPAFEFELQAPEPIALTQPALEGERVEVARDAALRIAWSGGGEGELTVLLDRVRCQARASDGFVTVDPSLLAEVASPSDLQVWAVTSMETRVRDWAIWFGTADRVRLRDLTLLD